jgi:hypothetical protein
MHPILLFHAQLFKTKTIFLLLILIHSIKCSWRLADVQACSQKVSHPEIRLVSAAIGAAVMPIFPFHNDFFSISCTKVCQNALIILKLQWKNDRIIRAIL